MHVFVANATDDTSTRPAIQEGVAEALSGKPIGRWDHVPLDDLRSMLTIRSSLSVPYEDAHHFFAWVVDRFGLARAIDAHLATASVADDEAFETALAQSLGFDSLAALHQEYEATRADFYPAVPETARVFTFEELQSSVALDTSCSGAYTEGPLAGWIWTTPIIEVVEAGQHGVDLELPMFFNIVPRIRLRPSAPMCDLPMKPAELEKLDAQSCPFDTDPPRFVFPDAGVYEIVLGLCGSQGFDGSWCDGWHSPEESFQTDLSLDYVGGDECTYP